MEMRTTSKYLDWSSSWLCTVIKRISKLKVQTLLRKKLDEIASYFGEDTNTSCCCDTRKLFGVLSEFKRALLLSKASTEWRISRNSHS